MFGAEKVIHERISKSDLRVYFVDFELQDDSTYAYRWKHLINLLQDSLVDFAYWLHEGEDTPNEKIISKLNDAARSIYKIKEFQEVKEIIESWWEIEDSVSDDIDKKYLKRWEFWELILHLLLRDFHWTIPLLSKIYFKDSYWHTVHGFDAVHIHPESRQLWLWESKLYVDGKRGIKELIKDIKEHFKRDYLQDEFSIITKKITPYESIPEKEHWLDLMHKNTKLEDCLSGITIPLLCTYSSGHFETYATDLESLIQTEVEAMKTYFDAENDHPLKTKLNIILLLFPIKDKNELVRRMHKKLATLQDIDND